MPNYIKINSMQVEETFYNFVCNEVLPGTKLEKEYFWIEAVNLFKEFDAPNKSLLIDRQRIQSLLDSWNEKNCNNEMNLDSYKEFLTKIGYLEKEGQDFKITTKHSDPEIGKIAGPQLVVPVTNARYAINAANARWGSLYDAIYGTDVMGDKPSSLTYDSARGLRVIEWVRSFLDNSLPLVGCSWADLTEIIVEDNNISLSIDAIAVELRDTCQFKGTKVDQNGLKTILFKKNDLGIIVVLNSNSKIGGVDKVGISDVLLESALSVIMDCEDSVATVDPDDKILAYRNWLGLMKGELQEDFQKDGSIVKRKLTADFTFMNPDGKELLVKGRALMLVRNVGHLMSTGLVLNELGEEIGEGLVDCLITAACGLHDLLKHERPRNSDIGSIYIVKPKMHGSSEVEFTVRLFDAVEKLLLLPIDTLKLGIMDEERRTSLNLKECIRAAKSRIAFINTGFLDRTGDEIHSSMRLGPLVRKADMKKEEWINAYERNNVQVGLRCGFQGKAQIGKGMWAMPDRMKLMLEEKSNHPRSGGSCAWVPSPTAATLHAIHYHETYVPTVQLELLEGEKINYQQGLLKVPTVQGKNWSKEEIEEELFNNAQGILGYVVRWVDQGIGCSTVPDINGIGLMEDRATCRISSQHIANWLYHGILSRTEVLDAFKKMAFIVDQQNNGDDFYTPMSPNFDSFAFMASLDLALKGFEQPSGYTEPLLHLYRKKKKALVLNN
ncbi:MAG: malate synthase G [Paracoccaceae bacterium]|nr:malate synthase G [Paracoccaceae bacterium]